MQISEHFSLQELSVSELAVRNGWDNSPSPQELENLTRLAQLLEQIRTLLGKPIVINSAFRSKQVNDAVGSKDSSQHRIGCAADIRVVGMNPDEVCKAIMASEIQYDQIIREFYDPEKGGGWTHISVPNKPNDYFRYSKLIIDRNGTRAFA
jgi:zinc D-Ala-D-Ala carboxypeptidase